MDAVFLLKFFLLMAILAAITFPVIWHAHILDKRIADGDIGAARTKAIIITVLAALLVGGALLRPPDWAEEPWQWITAVALPLAAMIQWLNVAEMHRKQEKSSQETRQR